MSDHSRDCAGYNGLPCDCHVWQHDAMPHSIQEVATD